MELQETLYDPAHGEIVHQTYPLPWPMKTRELLMKCENIVQQPRVLGICRSVTSPLAPVNPNYMRMDIVQSTWAFEPISDQQTSVQLKISVSEEFAAGVPSFVIDYVQGSSLKESVRNFEAAAHRLQLPPNPRFISWAGRVADSGGESAQSLDHRDPIESFLNLISIHAWNISVFLATFLSLLLWGHEVRIVLNWRKVSDRISHEWASHPLRAKLRVSNQSTSGTLSRSISELCLMDGARVPVRSSRSLMSLDAIQMLS